MTTMEQIENKFEEATVIHDDDSDDEDGICTIKNTDIKNKDGKKMFLEYLGYSKDDVEDEEPLRRIFLKNGKTIRLWNIEEDDIYLVINYSIL
jgi:hypothetical protein